MWRLIALHWGKLGDFAQLIQEGAHLAVEGSLVRRELTDKVHDDVKHRIWEVRAASILQLDRTAKAEETLDPEAADDEAPE